jgi:oxygen-independent coproporphyrinogen-3 oxidase
MSALSLYLHFPWCVRKCPYCDFNSHPLRTDGPNETGYLSALETDLSGQLAELGQVRIETLFCGGGTPSLFSPDAFTRILEFLAPWLAADAEITMEANPGTTEHQDLAGYRRAGINRLSLGVQSFDNGMLQALGRIHDADDVQHSYGAARRAGFDNINLDLMYGLPDQTGQAAMQDLQTAIDLAPEHLSWYQLTLEPRTEFARRPPRLPADDVLEDIETSGYRRLNRAGYERYEVSAYARPGRRCAHNLRYWTFGDYLGAGAGAHGKLSRSLPDGIFRTAKASQPRLYLADPGATTTERVPAERLPAEFMLNALRLTDGVALEDFQSATGLPLSVLDPMRSRQIEAGLLRPDRLAATERGYQLLDSLISDYL